MRELLITALLVLLILIVDMYATTFDEMIDTKHRLQSETERSSSLENTIKELKRFSNPSDHIQECDARMRQNRDRICAEYLQQLK